MDFQNSPFRSLSRGARRDRIVWAAKHVFFQKGVEEASMDDVAASAGTTKPTVYAHFKSKDELFSAVVELIKGAFVGNLGSPADYADDPVEAVTRFCGRILELVCWRDAIGFQRVAVATASRSPVLSREVYDKLFAESIRSLAAYLDAHELTPNPEPDAELVLSATVGMPLLRYLYGVDAPCEEAPGAKREDGAARVDLARIRETVALFATRWQI